ncbi:MAG: bacillithiol system redox-active protein YtxJ [Saprospiraceae bacterium]|nr:bacillithiol system redox-active protein YtxJ [Saprospiraceae bacterium]
MNWNELNTITQIEDLKLQSNQRPILIFKHSTRCGISSMVKRRFEKHITQNFKDTSQFYYLDLIKNRTVSNAVSEQFNVQHESPQVIVLYKGNAIYNASHNGIDAEKIESQMHAVVVN